MGRRSYKNKNNNLVAQKTRASNAFVSSVNKVGGHVRDYVTSFDENGYDITLNYKGEDSFQTMPGGAMSLVMWLLVITYAFQKTHAMITKSEWSLTQQTLPLSDYEIVRRKDFHDEKYSNLTVDLILFKRRTAADTVEATLTSETLNLPTE